MNQKYEIILKREDGSRVKILSLLHFVGRPMEEKPKYDRMCFHCPKGKKKFVQIFENNPFFPSDAEIKTAHMELWHTLKP
jgi:hypothetical protein